MNLSKKQRKFIETARKLSLKSDHRAKLGAVIVLKNHPVGFGFNNGKKTHPKANNRFRTLHAEVSAILSAGEDVNGADIYIYREHANGDMACSKPCQFCEKLLKEVGIKNVYYTDNGKVIHQAYG